MTNILLDLHLGQTNNLLLNDLKNYIEPSHRVAVVAFSFRDNRVRSLANWEALYGKKEGLYYSDIVEAFQFYEIKERNIEFINYFTDSKITAREKVTSADILYFLGGLPDRMYDRLIEFDLIETVSRHQGIAIGYSAGAVIQLGEYHLSPDNDYPGFAYYNGIPYINDFYLEVHYEETDMQKESIKRVLKEKKKPVYALHNTDAMIYQNGSIKLFGNIEVFNP